MEITFIIKVWSNHIAYGLEAMWTNNCGRNKGCKKQTQKRNDTAKMSAFVSENALEPYGPASKIEDSAMKTAAQFLGEELLPYFKVASRIKRIFPTESIQLSLRRLYQDFNYEMMDDSIVHLEFQSTPVTRKDLRRFREYEATTSSIFNKPVITYVLISGKVKKSMSSLTEGVNNYHIVPITMQDDNADEWMEKIDRSIAGQGLPTAQELLPLVLLPLMSGASSLRERISYAFRVLHKVEKEAGRSEKLDKMHAILYAFAYKFLKAEEFRLIKEEISMTELGQMLVDDGIKIGEKRGEIRGEKRGKRDGIRIGTEALIETCQELGLSCEETAQKVMLRFGYAHKKAAEEVQRCWK